MNETQTEHMFSIITRVVHDIQEKYTKGQHEHGGNLWDRDVSKDIVDESLDLITYAYTADYKRTQALSCIKSFLSYRNESDLQQAIEWLTNKQIPQQLPQQIL